MGYLTQTLTLLLLDDTSARSLVANSDIVPVLLDLLTRAVDQSEKREGNAESGNGELPKWVPTVLLTLDSLAQLPLSDSPPDSLVIKENLLFHQVNVFCYQEKPRYEPYLTIAQQEQALTQIVKIMERPIHPLNSEALLLAVLQLCSRLTRNHELAIKFMELKGINHLFELPLPSDKNSRYVHIFSPLPIIKLQF